MTCKDCIHYCICKDMWADENWTDEAPAEIRKMFSPEGCENFTAAADVAPIIHGEWREEFRSQISPDDYFYWNTPQKKNYVCSICGREEVKKEPYCNCGARMDGGKE